MQRCDALDWLKAIGITLIVYGHVAHATTVTWVPPIYVKQFGVAFFLFAAGFTLARESRAPVAAVVSRLVPVYVFGLATAVAITAAGVVFGTGLEPSNYMPLVAGSNVVVNNFPANPTTWYLGTYLHALLLWAVLFSNRRPGFAAIGAALMVEIPARIALQVYAGPYVAYMLLTNWLGVFVMGVALGTRPTVAVATYRWAYAVALAAGLALVSQTVRSWNPVPEFPFMRIGAATVVELIPFSLLVSGLYLSVTLLTFKIVELAPAPAAVGFFARNSLIIVLLHMPLFMALNPVLIRLGWPYGARVVLHLLLCLPLLAWFSEVVTRVVRPKAMASSLVDFMTIGRLRIQVRRTAPSLGRR